MSSISGLSGQQYWRSLDELADTPEFRAFVEQEFPSYAPELLASPSRRQFLKIMGASLALGGLTACRWPREEVLPFANQPAGRKPGEAVHYATACDRLGVGIGLLATSFDGRPVKIEGNPLHPGSLGATDAALQSAILELYDPDRSRVPIERSAAAGGGQQTATQEHERTWDQAMRFLESHFEALRAKGGAGLCILASPASGPSFDDMRARVLQALPQVAWFEYTPVSRDNERAGIQSALGAALRPHLNLAECDVVVSLDSDFLLQHPDALRHMRDWGGRRRGEEAGMLRLWSFESHYSLTGSNADHRHAVRSAEVAAVAGRLAALLIDRGLTVPNAPDSIVATLREIQAPTGVQSALQRLADDLFAHRGRAAVVVGERQAPEVHALACLLNAALGGGRAVTYTELVDRDRPSHAESIAALSDRLNAGDVDTLLVLDTNPVYDAPADLNFAERIGRARVSIHLGLYADETGARCHWHLPAAHFLESWGDCRAYNGVLSITQPLIDPLYGGLSPLQVLAIAAGDSTRSAHEIVQRTWTEMTGSAPEGPSLWRKALHDGVWGDPAPTVQPAVQSLAWVAGLRDRVLSAAGRDAIEVAFVPDNKIYAGLGANSGWLQELPDPLTKLTWDNAAIISPADARRLSVRRGDVLRIQLGNRTLEIACFVLPGQAEGSITLPLGYGRTSAGVVARGAGVDVYPLRTRETLNFASGAQVSPAGRRYELVTTQDHQAMVTRVGEAETKRRAPILVREGTLEDFQHHPDFAKHVVHLPQLNSLWKEHEYHDYKWGMAIDLTACTGCGACVVACQAENNIPVVGKDEVARGREMHWIRVDRYFRGEPEDPSVQASHQPVPCMHCEMAPCEQVCPVAATLHDSDGLNVMVYNRCVGTRYCSNNCPYKVRRFNWFYHHHGPKHPRGRTDLDPVERMGMNPDVTVRSRGVMEKCTYCVQRINRAKIHHRNAQVARIARDGREAGVPRIPDGELLTACQQACPAAAITFGDLNDAGSRVRRMQEHPRSYAMLAELNTKPRTVYLARLRNPLGGTAAAEHAGEAAH